MHQLFLFLGSSFSAWACNGWLRKRNVVLRLPNTSKHHSFKRVLPIRNFGDETWYCPQNQHRNNKTIQWQPQQYSLRKCWRWHCCLIGFAAALSSTKDVNTSAHPDTASVFGMAKKIKQGEQSSLPFPIIILWSTGLCCSYFFKNAFNQL